MGTLYITEFSNIGFHNQGESHSTVPAQIPTMFPVAEQVVTISGVSTQSNVFNPRTNFIRLMADAPCSVSVGLNPSAVSENMRLPANRPERFGLASIGLSLAVIGQGSGLFTLDISVLDGPDILG